MPRNSASLLSSRCGCVVSLLFCICPIMLHMDVIIYTCIHVPLSHAAFPYRQSKAWQAHALPVPASNEGCSECTASQGVKWGQSQRHRCACAQAWMDGLGAGAADYAQLAAAIHDVEEAGQLHLGEALGPRWARPGRAGQLDLGEPSQPRLS